MCRLGEAPSTGEKLLQPIRSGIVTKELAKESTWPYESLILTFVTSPYPEMSVPPKANKPWLAICMLHATTAQKATTITVEVNGRPFRTLVAWYSLSMVTLA
ncbi:uncharacterized [Tachysurus ichikawai]